MILIIFTYICFFPHLAYITLIPFSEQSSHNEDDDNFANEPNGSEEITSPFIEQQEVQTKELPIHRVV